MKQILPILTLTTLTAAAFADAGAAAPAAPAAAGLSYNRVGISRQGQNNDISVSNLIGGSNVLVTLSTVASYDGGSAANNYTHLSLGYVFKNVVAGIDATVSVGQGDRDYGSSVGVNFRRSLNEVFAGLEVAVGYSRQARDTAATVSAWSYELAYNVTKQYSVAYGIVDPNGASKNLHVVSLRYNY
jgi:hypothetical protein